MATGVRRQCLAYHVRRRAAKPCRLHLVAVLGNQATAAAGAHGGASAHWPAWRDGDAAAHGLRCGAAGDERRQQRLLQQASALWDSVRPWRLRDRGCHSSANLARGGAARSGAVVSAPAHLDSDSEALPDSHAVHIPGHSDDRYLRSTLAPRAHLPEVSCTYLSDLCGAVPSRSAMGYCDHLGHVVLADHPVEQGPQRGPVCHLASCQHHPLLCRHADPYHDARGQELRGA
mmetsp:Transcript_15949/g.43364  ORF Transcript_15949/g.43364 Transcript_15949/m.43364 type:complete len:231 (+) Transcript_15949:177-869(+)